MANNFYNSAFQEIPFRSRSLRSIERKPLQARDWLSPLFAFPLALALAVGSQSDRLFCYKRGQQYLVKRGQSGHSDCAGPRHRPRTRVVRMAFRRAKFYPEFDVLPYCSDGGSLCKVKGAPEPKMSTHFLLIFVPFGSFFLS